jgi:DNA-binding transcriptional MerR regulator
VLRYWETEFPTLQPQKNRAGQRTYRRKDVEMALRIKELLYHEGFTIAGAKRKLLSEGRGGAARLKVVPPGGLASPLSELEPSQLAAPAPAANNTAARPVSRDTIKRLRLMLEDMLVTLNREV